MNENNNNNNNKKETEELLNSRSHKSAKPVGERHCSTVAYLVSSFLLTIKKKKKKQQLSFSFYTIMPETLSPFSFLFSRRMNCCVATKRRERKSPN